MTRTEEMNAAATNATTGTAALGRRTLRQLGVPGALAIDLEAALRAMGKVEGGRITGYRFVTPDGVSHALRLGEERSRAAGSAGRETPERDAA